MINLFLTYRIWWIATDNIESKSWANPLIGLEMEKQTSLYIIQNSNNNLL